MKSGIAILFSYIFLIGCSAVPTTEYEYGTSKTIVGIEPNIDVPQAQLYSLASANTKLLDEFYSIERPYYRSNRADPSRSSPHQCIALSGGGSRSAAFGLGVLANLDKTRMLDDIDVISSVSGGGYASFFHIANTVAGDSADDIYSTQGMYLQNVAKRPLLDTFWGVWSALTTPLCQPFVWFFRGFGAEFRTCGASNYYVKLAGVYANRAKGNWYSKTLSSIVSSVSDGIIPYPVFNTAASAGPDRECSSSDPKSYGNPHEGGFEITPIRSGSEYFGFSENLQQRFSIARAVAISGAALDSPSWKFCRLQSFLGFKTGANIRKYESLVNGQLNVKSIYLADGGFVEMLGVYSLIKRHCDQMVIVDASHDPGMNYGAYRKLREQLQSSANGLTLVSSTIDDEIDLHAKACRDWSIDNPDSSRRNCYRARAAERLVHNGFIGDIPIIDADGEPIRKQLRFTYIKLGVSESDISLLPEDVEIRLKQKPICKGEQNCAFPHEWDRDQNFDDSQFWAYFKLGFHLSSQRDAIDN